MVNIRARALYRKLRHRFHPRHWTGVTAIFILGILLGGWIAVGTIFTWWPL